MNQLRKLEKIIGYSLRSHEEEIGKLEQVYFDDQQWKVRYLVVNTGNWLFGKQILIVPDAISGIDDEENVITVDLTRDKIKNSPDMNTVLPVSRQHEQDYYHYYGWEPYWTADPIFGFELNRPIEPEPDNHSSTLQRGLGNSHLRSSDEVKGYRIDAIQGNIGHVADLIIEDQLWAVRYLEVDTRNWLPGKHVLIAPTWIKKVAWVGREVKVELKREAIETAPAYDRDMIISGEYQVALLKHYGGSLTKK